MVTPAVDDQAVVEAGEEVEDGEVATTTATTIHLRHILPTLLTPSQHRTLLLVHPRGALDSSLAQRLAQPLATRWAIATTAVPRPVKQDHQTGLEMEMEAGRNLGLRGRLEGVDRLRVLHRLAARGMNRLVSGGVAGGRRNSSEKQERGDVERPV